MRKILFGVFFLAVTIRYADASIISRGFLDEALESYATTTALDLKADKVDLTALETKVGTLPTVLPLGEAVRGFVFGASGEELASIPTNVGDFLSFLYSTDKSVPSINNIIDAITYGELNTTETSIDEKIMGLKYLNNSLYGLFNRSLPSGKTNSFNSKLFGEPYASYPESVYDMITGLYGRDGIFDDMLQSHGEAGFLGLFQLTEAVIPMQTVVGDGFPSLNLVDNLPYFSELFSGLSLTSKMSDYSYPEWIVVSYMSNDFPGLAGVTNKLLNGWTNSEKNFYPGIKGMFDGWTDPNKVVHSGLNTISTDYDALLNAYSVPSLYQLLMKGGRNPFHDDTAVLPLHALSAEVSKIGELPSDPMSPSKGLAVLLPGIEFRYPNSLGEFMLGMYDAGSTLPGLSDLADAVYYGTMDSPAIHEFFWVKGLHQITQEIGTLPSGTVLGFGQTNVTDPLYKALQQTNNPVLPNSLEEMIFQIYGTPKTPGIVTALLQGFPFDEALGLGSVGILPAMNVANTAQATADSALSIAKTNTGAIGILPSGPTSGLGRTYVAEPLYQDVQQTENPVLPGSLAELINQIYGTTTKQGIITTLLKGFNYEGSLLGIMPAMAAANTAQTTADTAKTTADTAKTTADTAKSVADANTAKIGTVPSEYSTVGDALTAMDAKIDAHELPADSDDGQYVLSAKKVGDTITYTWVKMDLTDAEK